MAKYKLLTDNEKAIILALRKENFSVRAISRRIKRNIATISRFLKKYSETGTIANRKRGGAKRKTTVREDRVLQRLCLQNRASTSKELCSEWNESTGVSVCSSTVRRRLKSMGLTARRPCKKPLLTTKMRKARLDWARNHVNWTVDDWNNVIFSDESKFNLHGTDGINFVRRRKGERLKDSCLKSTVKFPTSIMVWGCFSSKGVGPLHVLERTVKAQDYIQILEDCLMPTIEEQFGDASNCIFQDDSAPCHRAKIVSVLNFLLN